MEPIIPWYVATIILVTAVTLTFWLYRLVAHGIDNAALEPRTRSRFRLTTAVFLAGWLGLALFLAPSTPAVDVAGRPVVPATFLFFGVVTLGLAVGLLAFSSRWRAVIDAIPAHALISAQFYRIIGGLIFLPLYALGTMPRYFALPAGLGDLTVALLAPWVALAVQRRARGARQLALGWNVFGFLDLVTAVGLGTGLLLPLLQPGNGPGPASAAMTFFPLALIPTFAVPLGFILHIYSIRRTLRGEATNDPLRGPVPQSESLASLG